MQRPDPTGRVLRVLCHGLRTWALRFPDGFHYCERCGKRVKVAW